MNPLRLLYVGATTGTSQHRADALTRLGHDVLHLSPYAALPPHWRPWLYRTGGPGLDPLVARALATRIGTQKFDAALVDCGDVVGPAALAVLRRAAPAIGHYCADNPYADPPSERRRWRIFRRACAQYDLLVTPRRPGAEAAVRRLTGKAPLQIWQCADERVHRPRAPGEPHWRSEVIFVGTFMPGRDSFLSALLDYGVPLRIHGARWERAPLFWRLRPVISPGHLDGDDYARAVAGAKLALVLLNPANGDLHTTRSAEIPAIGTAMCAPRTAQHAELYRHGTEAMLFDNADTCAALCHALLADETLRHAVAAAGHRRTFANATYNEPLMAGIIDALPQARSGLRNAA